MAKLILSMDGLVLKEIPLTKERTTIGRKPHNDIQIDNLAVSGEHAVIVTILNDSFLEDLGSTNGTVVNGNPIKKHFLQNNDVVELGKYKLKFVGEPAPVAGAEKADFEKTMVLRPAAMKAAAEQAKAMARGAARAQGSRRDRAGRRENGILPEGLTPNGRPSETAYRKDRPRPRDHAVLHRARRRSVPGRLHHPARQHHLRHPAARHHAARG